MLLQTINGQKKVERKVYCNVHSDSSNGYENTIIPTSSRKRMRPRQSPEGQTNNHPVTLMPINQSKYRNAKRISSQTEAYDARSACKVIVMQLLHGSVKIRPSSFTTAPAHALKSRLWLLSQPIYRTSASGGLPTRTVRSAPCPASVAGFLPSAASGTRVTTPCPEPHFLDSSIRLLCSASLASQVLGAPRAAISTAEALSVAWSELQSQLLKPLPVAPLSVDTLVLSFILVAASTTHKTTQSVIGIANLTMRAAVASKSACDAADVACAVLVGVKVVVVVVRR